MDLNPPIDEVFLVGRAIFDNGEPERPGKGEECRGACVSWCSYADGGLKNGPHPGGGLGPPPPIVVDLFRSIVVEMSLRVKAEGASSSSESLHPSPVVNPIPARKRDPSLCRTRRRSVCRGSFCKPDLVFTDPAVGIQRVNLLIDNRVVIDLTCRCYAENAFRTIFIGIRVGWLLEGLRE